MHTRAEYSNESRHTFLRTSATDKLTRSRNNYIIPIQTQRRVVALNEAELWFVNSLFNEWSPGERDIPAVMTGQMSYEIEVDCSFVFTVSVVLSMQNLRLPSAFGGRLLKHIGIILIFRADLTSDCICAPKCLPPNFSFADTTSHNHMEKCTLIAFSREGLYYVQFS
jgi:hypothetical protein